MMRNRILVGDCRETLRSLPDGSVDCCVTSPPYFKLRDYGGQSLQIGQEQSPDEFVRTMVEVFREVRRVLRDDGTLWLNLGDSYGKDKSRLMMPARTALALQQDGWLLRDEIVWHKPKTTPAPLKDRTVSAHEMIYLFAKQRRYHFDYLAIEEPAKYAGDTRQNTKVFRRLTESRLNTKNNGQTYDPNRVFTVRATRRKRSVWSVSPVPYKEGHFATFPPKLIEPCIIAGCPVGGIVLDPFIGSGTTAMVAQQHGRGWIGCELNPEYVPIIHRRVGIEQVEDDFDALLGDDFEALLAA